MATISDDGLWQVDEPDPSVGIFGTAVYHQKSEACDTVSADIDSVSLKAVCSCGAVLEVEDDRI